MKKLIAAVAVLALGLVAAFGVFVWPTAWRYENTPSHLVRVNRFDGGAEYLTKAGWRPILPRATGASTIAMPPATPEQCAAFLSGKDPYVDILADVSACKR